MRYELKFTIEQPALPLDYRSGFISFFKFALSHYEGGRFYNDFYEPGVNKGISFAVLFRKPSFTEGRVTLGSRRIRVILAIPDKKTAFIFLNALLHIRGKGHPISAVNKLKLHAICPVEEKMVRGNIGVYQIVSPLCLRLHDRKTNQDAYVSCRHKNFSAVLLKSLRGQIADYDHRLVPLMETLQVNTAGCQKTVVTHYGCQIEVTIGHIAFMGAPELLSVIEKVNLGSRKNAGFGLVKLVDEGGVLCDY